MVDVLYPSNFVWVQIKYIKFCQILQVLYLFDIILSKHEHSKRRDCVEMANFLYVIVVKVEEYQIRETDQVFNFSYQIMLQI